MKFLKRKQIIVLSLVLMLVIAGYLQYSYNKSSQFSEEDSTQIGDAVFVDNLDVTTSDASKTVTASKETNNYFAQTKMDRDVVRGKDIETMKSISDDQLASKDDRAKARNEMMKMVDTTQKEINIENLIKGKGFSDAIALFADDGSIDIIVKTPAISMSDAAKIADIAIRQGNVTFDKVVIKKMF